MLASIIRKECNLEVFMKKFLIVLVLLFLASGIVFSADEYVTVRLVINQRSGGVMGYVFSDKDFSLSGYDGGGTYVYIAVSRLCNYMFEKGYLFIQGGMWGLDPDSTTVLFKKK